MKSKTKTETHILVGHRVGGYATLNMWGGGQGSIEMDKTFIPIQHPLTKETILGCVNDGQFGCESLASAEIDIYEVWNAGSFKYDDLEREIILDAKQCRKYHKLFFRGI